MKLMTFAVTVVVACWITATAAAQQTLRPTEQPAHSVFVLTGCFEQGNGTSTFRLTGASAIGQAPPRSSTSAAIDTTSADVYELKAASVSEQGLSREKLQPEVGAKVEVTIRPAEATSPRQAYTVIKIDRLANSCV